MQGAVICRLSKGSDRNEKNEMGRVYGKYGGQENCIRGLGGGGHLREKDQLEDLGVDRKIILNRSSRSGMERHELN